MNWLKDNIEWIFSGIGVSIIGFVIHFFSKKSKNKVTKVNIKAGNDVHYVKGDSYTVENLSINHIKPHNPDEKVSLVDISIEQSDEFPILDIKLRNNTENVVFFKELEIEIVDKWVLHQNISPSMVPVSWTYDIILPESIGKSNINKLSQEIPPKSTDRFELKVKGESSTIFGLTLYLFKIKLIYNENNSYIVSPFLLTNIPAEVEIEGSYNPGISDNLLKTNNQMAKKIIELVNTKNILVDKNVKNAILSWANAL